MKPLILFALIFSFQLNFAQTTTRQGPPQILIEETECSLTVTVNFNYNGQILQHFIAVTGSCRTVSRENKALVQSLLDQLLAFIALAYPGSVILFWTVE